MVDHFAYPRLVLKRAGEGWPYNKLLIAQCRQSLAEQEDPPDGYVWLSEYVDVYYSILKHMKLIADFHGQPFILAPWQAWAVAEMVGWREVDDPTLHRYHDILIKIPKKQGKTTWVCSLVMYFIICVSKDAEVFSFATSKEQAKITYNNFRRMLVQMPAPVKHKFVVMENMIRYVTNGSIFKPLHAQSSRLDGLECQVAIFDEAAAVTDSEQFTAINTGMLTRRNPLRFYTTTSQTFAASDFYQGLEERYELSVLGEVKQPRLFGLVFRVDPDEKGLPPAKLADKRLIEACNPSVNVTTPMKRLMEDAREAEHSVSKRSAFLTKNLNFPASAAGKFVDLTVWQNAERPAAEIDQLLANGKSKTYAGLDLSMKSDLTALSLLHDFGDFIVSEFFAWLPRDTYAGLPPILQSACNAGQAEGILTLLNEPNISNATVVDKLEEVKIKYNLQSIDCDQWHADGVHEEAQLRGIEVVLTRCNTLTLAPGLKNLKRLIERGQVLHKNSRFINYQFLSVELDTDKNELQSIKKKDLRQGSRRVDNITAMNIANKMRMSLDKRATVHMPDDDDFDYEAYEKAHGITYN